MTVAAIDRRVHHATILEMNAESFRQRAAASNKRAEGRSPSDNHHRQPKRRRKLTQKTEKHANPGGLKNGQDGCRPRIRWLTL
jgi:hypothetical protein